MPAIFLFQGGGIFAAKAAKCPSLLIYQVTIGYFPYHKIYHNITNHIISYKSGESPGYPGGVPARKLFILTPPLPPQISARVIAVDRRLPAGFAYVRRSSRGTGVAGVACAREGLD